MAVKLSPAEFAHALSKLDDPKDWRKKLRKVYRQVGNASVKWARAEMRGSDRQLAAAARFLRANASTTTTSLVTSNRQHGPMLVAVWGTKKKLGWYGGWTRIDGESVWDEDKAKGFEDGPPNAPGWVGDSWTVATEGQGPRGINDALARHQDEMLDIFATASMDLIMRAFPRSGGKVTIA